MASGESARCRQYARELVQTYFRMLTVGCGATTCENAYCRSSSHDAAAAAIQSIWLATQAPVPLCITIRGSDCSAASEKVDPFEARHDRPETDDDDDRPETDNSDDDTIESASEAATRSSTPRQRLSNAVELALTLTAASPAAPNSASPGKRLHSRDRKLSLPKQKLLDAITKSLLPASPTVTTSRSLLEVDARQSSGR